MTFVTPAFLHPERPDFPGVRRYSTELVQALARGGTRVRVVTPALNGEVDELRGKVEVVRLRRRWGLLGRTGNIAQARMLAFAKTLATDPNLVRTTDIVHSTIPLLAIDAIRSSCPVVAFGHHVERVRGPGDFLSVPFGNSYGSYTYRRADAVITPSEATASRLARRFGISRRRIEVIHHGVDTSKFSPGDPGHERSQDQPARRILFVGPMHRRKNVLLLLDAFGQLLRTHPDAQLVLVGSGPLDRQIDRTIRKDPLQGKVLRMESLDDTTLRQLYRSAEIFASPSVDEGFGFAVVEAMACRIPVVVLNTQVEREIVGDAGLLVKEASPEAWSRALGGVLEDSRFARAMAERGWRRATEQYSWKAAAEQYVQKYRGLVERRASRGD